MSTIWQAVLLGRKFTFLIKFNRLLQEVGWLQLKYQSEDEKGAFGGKTSLAAFKLPVAAQ